MSDPAQAQGGASPAAGASAQLARFACELAFDTIPPAVSAQVRDLLVDFVANAAFGARFADSSAAFRAGVDLLAPAGGECTAIAEPRRYPAQYAALLNGTYAHTLDFDDTSLYGGLHPGAPVIAAALAAAESERADGCALIEGVVAGYEVACRVGAAIGTTSYDRGFHATPVAGIFGAVAAAGRITRATQRQMIDAFGLAGSFAAGSMQYLDNGAWNKRVHPGKAAHDALVALAFARAGVLGATSPLEGRYGVLAGYSNAPRPELLTDRLGQWWATPEVGLKPYPSCRLTHGAIDAALALRSRLAPGVLAAAPVRVRLSPKAVQIVGEPVPNKVRARSVVDGQFSVYFQVATALLDGACNWDSYRRLAEPDVEALCARITVEADPAVAIAGARVEVGGAAQVSETVDAPLGEPERPLGWAGLRAKLDDLGGRIYGERTTASVGDAIAGLSTLGDVRALTALLGGPAS